MPRLLVGRARELATLQSAVAHTRSGRGGVLLVAGAAGAGKSRLAEELARLAALDGLTVAWGRAWEAGSAPAFWPWLQVARSLGATDLAQRLLGGGDVGALGHDRFELFDACAQELARESAARRLAILLEDLHVADRPSLLLLAFAAQQLMEAPVLFLGTYRDVEMRLSSERSAILVDLRKHAETISPTPLRAGDIEHLVRDVVGEDADPALAAAMHAATDGNPLFVHELLRLVETDGPEALAGAVPDGIRAAIRRHVGLVGAPCRQALEAAAVLGRELMSETLTTVLARDANEVAALLTEAVRAGLVGEVGRRHRFTHALVRDTLYDDLARDARCELHRRAGEALAAAAHVDDPGAPLADIARHFDLAGPATAERAIEYAVRASRVAAGQLAFEQAVVLLENALDIVDRGAARSVSTQGELLVELGQARIQAGDGQGGRSACRQAVAIARSIGSPQLLARAALAFGSLFTFGRVDGELVALLEEALQGLGAEPSPERARLLARLAGALQPAADPRVPIARAREAIAVARAFDAPAVLAQVMVGAGSALQDIADPALRLPVNHELLQLAQRRADRTLELRARFRLAFDHLEQGDPAGADAEMRSYERAATGLRQRRHHAVPAMWWAMRALLKGRWAEHDDHLAMARGLGADGAQLGCHAFLAARLRGERERSAELVGGARWFLDAIPASVAFVEALLLADRGRHAEARAALARVPAAAHVASVPTILRVLLAEAVWRCRDVALARELLPAYLPFADRIGAWSMTAMFCDGPLARHVALVAATAGDTMEAERRWEQATAIARADDERPVLVHLALERAECIDDVVRARAFAHEARELADQLALPLLAARADAVLGCSPTAEARGAPRPAPALLVELARDGDTWTVRGGGESVNLRDSRGLRMLAVLVDRVGEEVTALELDASAGATIDGGDAGALLDARATRSYRARAQELELELEEATSYNDAGRIQRARAELDALRSELARALGLGGRQRRAGTAGERARINVQRRVSDALRRIEASCPQLGRHLAATVRTGTTCWYDPGSRKRPSS